MIDEFNFAATPHIHFGCGKRSLLPTLAKSYGERVLLISGGASFDGSTVCTALMQALSDTLELRRLRVSGEPSPSLVDEAVAEYRHFDPGCVIAVGGGSAVDAAKAIAGLLPLGHSVMEYLEGVGKGKAYSGPSTPFIAVPTTAGTGGETSKNAVLSVVGEGGFKKSFRDEMLVPKHIILDPELTVSCPGDVSAACGMDALTQLIESYVSNRSNPMTDALALSGIRMVREALPAVVADGADKNARSKMLYASSISGLTLANAGLGSVHGLASPLGAFFPISHGVVCGTLVHAATELNLIAMRSREPNNPALKRYADVGRAMRALSELSDDDACMELLDVLADWTHRLGMRRLGDFGISEEEIPRIVSGSRGNSMQTNPIELTDEEIAGLIRARL